MASKGKSHSVVHFLRHAHSEANLKGILAGRRAGVHLSKSGLTQALQLVKPLKELKLDYLHISPLDRCWETVTPFIDATSGVEISADPHFVEMDYGQWSGKKLAVLSKKALWSTIQRNPSQVRFPDGESFIQMQSRVIEGVESIRSTPGTHLVVSHGDVIRVALTHYFGAHLDAFQKLAIGPATLSTIIFDEENVVISGTNIPISRSQSSGLGESTLGGGSGRL
jgi:probable phosphomutase (TIGR03848 family)